MSQTYEFDKELFDQQKIMFNRVNSGSTVDIEISEGIFEEMYLEKGMRATIIAMTVDICEMDSNGKTKDTIIKVTFDFSKFDEFNTPLQSHNWYDKAGVACLTATEAGQKPKNCIEDTFVSMSHSPFPFFELESSSMKMYNIFQKVPTHLSYVQWLEETLDKQTNGDTK
jgi:hypothetical protein